MRRLLLVSTSRTHGTGYLEHCADPMHELFAGCQRVLFVPWALKDVEGYAELARKRFEDMRFELDSIHEAPNAGRAVLEAEAIFIGGGNTFRLLKHLHQAKLLEPIRKRVAQGMPYMGTSAGSNVACPTIRTTNDMPIVEPPSFEALGLVSFQVNPHYLDPDPGSTHMGETRETRLLEYLEENDRNVVGLREGAMLRVMDTNVTLLGTRGARVFRPGLGPREYEPGADLSFLLS